jgi:hypothetical protein
VRQVTFSRIEISGGWLVAVAVDVLVEVAVEVAVAVGGTGVFVGVGGGRVVVGVVVASGVALGKAAAVVGGASGLHPLAITSANNTIGKIICVGKPCSFNLSPPWVQTRKIIIEDRSILFQVGR